MSQLRVMRNGKPDWQDQGPAFARRQGYGGSAIGFYSGTTLKVGPSTAVRKAAAQRDAERRRVAREKARTV